MNDELTGYYRKQDKRRMSAAAWAFLESWLEGMDEAVAMWSGAHMPDGYDADYSFSSLSVLERELLARFGTLGEFDEERQGGFLTGAARYYGETVVRNTPGRWFYQDKPAVEEALNRIPMILPNTPTKYLDRVVPMHTLKLMVRDRESGLLEDTALIIQDAFDEAKSDGRDWPSDLRRST